MVGICSMLELAGHNCWTAAAAANAATSISAMPP